MPEAQFSKIFLIGFNCSGGEWFKQIFSDAGLNWRHDRTGDLAINLAWHQARGTRPFDTWPQLQGISGLERWNRSHLPTLWGFKDYRFLQEQFPDALFIYNDRDPVDWVASRYFLRDGRFRAFEASRQGAEERDLPEIWLKERAAHKLRALRHFDGDPRFLHFDISQDSDDRLRDWIAPWVRLGALPEERGIEAAKDSIVQIDMLSDHMKENASRPRYRAGAPDQAFVDAVVRHCLGSVRDGVVEGKHASLSPAAAEWARNGTVLNRAGGQMPLRAGADGRYLAKEQEQAKDRVQAVLNELLEIGAVPPLTIDMQDAREAGVGERAPPTGATLVYNRRPGARNLVLWPLPGYHTLAPTGHPGGFSTDEIAFEDKPDQCIWYGNLTGKPIPHLATEIKVHRMAHQYLARLHDDLSEKRRAGIDRALMTMTRYRVMSRLHGKPGYDLGFVMPPVHAKAARDPLIAPYVATRMPDTWVHHARYVLSLSGNDTGSNFLPAAAGQGVILKEEDNWELFYTGAFKAWEHYIPLLQGGDDVEEQLDWARANPDRCKEISANATALFDKFARPENQRAWKQAVYEEVAALRGGAR